MNMYIILTLYTYWYLIIKMSLHTNYMTRHLKLRYISIFTNLLRTRNESKNVKFLYSYIN